MKRVGFDCVAERAGYSFLTDYLAKGLRPELECNDTRFRHLHVSAVRSGKEYWSGSGLPAAHPRATTVAPFPAWRGSQPQDCTSSGACQTCLYKLPRHFQWRRGWDSNPRYGFPYTAFPVLPVQPLLHLSQGKRNCHWDFDCETSAATISSNRILNTAHLRCTSPGAAGSSAPAR